MTKSADAFRTISEVAEWLELPTHVLRFWESKFSQIKPVKRAGGRRYYRPRDMQLIGGLKKLLHDDGMTIRGAQKQLKEHGVQYVIDLSPPLEPGLEAAIEPLEPPAEIVEMSQIVESIEQSAPQPVSDPITASRPNLRLVDTEEDQFDLFGSAEPENFWTDSDEVTTESDIEATQNTAEFVAPKNRLDQLAYAMNSGAVSITTLETLLSRVNSAIARRA